MLKIVVTKVDADITEVTLDDDYEPWLDLPSERPRRRKAKAAPKRSYWTNYDHNGNPRQGGFCNQHIRLQAQRFYTRTVYK